MRLTDRERRARWGDPRPRTKGVVPSQGNMPSGKGTKLEHMLIAQLQTNRRILAGWKAEPIARRLVARQPDMLEHAIACLEAVFRDAGLPIPEPKTGP